MSTQPERCRCGLENPGPEHRAYYPALCAERSSVPMSTQPEAEFGLAMMRAERDQYKRERDEAQAALERLMSDEVVQECCFALDAYLKSVTKTATLPVNAWRPHVRAVLEAAKRAVSP